MVSGQEVGARRSTHMTRRTVEHRVMHQVIQYRIREVAELVGADALIEGDAVEDMRAAIAAPDLSLAHEPLL